MSDQKQPEQVIADWRGHAQVLRARGHTRDADLLEQCAAEIDGSLGGFLKWMAEPDARLKSGRSKDYFRDHFAEWSVLGLAEMRGRTRYYRNVIVPQRAHASAAKAAGLRGERAG
jgi:hypothetical protein